MTLLSLQHLRRSSYRSFRIMLLVTVLTFSRYDADANRFKLERLEHSVTNAKSPNGLKVFK